MSVDQEGELFQQALLEEAATLGIQPNEEYLIHFAQESLLSEPPPPWVELIDPKSGHAYYLNNQTHESTWHNPATVSIRKAVERARAVHNEAMHRRQQTLAPAPVPPACI